HPVRNRHRANVAAFANQINNGPVSLAHLDVVQIQANQFRPAKEVEGLEVEVDRKTKRYRLPNAED
ncbi:MAG: hypothetical protein WA881_06225, partial [Candidatus Sulfotelmatobacter sp.]